MWLAKHLGGAPLRGRMGDGEGAYLRRPGSRFAVNVREVDAAPGRHDALALPFPLGSDELVDGGSVRPIRIDETLTVTGADDSDRVISFLDLDIETKQLGSDPQRLVGRPLLP